MRHWIFIAPSWAEEIRRIENKKGRFTLVFLAAPDDADARRAAIRLRWWS